MAYDTTVVNTNTTYTWATSGQAYSSSGYYSLISGCQTHVLNLTINTASGTHLYVDSSKVVSGNGLSWSTAYNKLSKALNTANNGTGNYVIHVAQGTYLPTDVNNVVVTSRDSSFTIFRKGISILGGYSAGGGTRNSKQYVTRMSGDIGTVGDNSDNLYHVLLLAINANTTDSLVIDGLNIESGNGNGNGGTVINGVSFSQNTGGGVFVNNNSGSTINNVFINNTLIQNNTVSSNGGGMENYNCTLTMIGSCFYNNSSNSYGGGLNNEAGGSLILINDVFTNNSNPGFGGGLRVSGSSTNQVINCTFTNNSGGTGAAIRVASLGTATVNIHNSIFRGNYSGSDFTSTNADVSNGATLFIDTSCLQSSQSCTGCLVANTDPLFVAISNPLGNDGFFGTADDGLILTSNSPCVNAGNDGIFNLYGIAKDIIGSPRIQSSHIDMGAYENGPVASVVTNGSFGTVYLCSGTPGNTNSFDVSGSGLLSNITVTAPTGIDISQSATSNFSNTAISLPAVNGSVAPTKIYVRVHNTVTTNFSDTIHVTSLNAPTQTLPVSAVVSNATGNNTSVTICSGSYTWAKNGTSYSQAGTYYYSNICEIDTLSLSIGQATTSTTTTTACDSLVWNGTKYTASGTYTHTFTGGNSLGCDSVATLVLTINATPKVTGVTASSTNICLGQTTNLNVNYTVPTSSTHALGTPNVGDLGAEYSYVISPNLSLSSGNATISFNSWSNNENLPYDQEYVDISADGGSTWTNITDSLSPGGINALSNDAKWRAYTVAHYFPSATTNAKLRFRYDTKDECCGGTPNAKGWYVDNVTVTQNNTSVAQYDFESGIAGWTTGNFDSTQRVPPFASIPSTWAVFNITSSATVTYAWTPTAGLSYATIKNPVATPSATQLYKVVVANAGCKDSGTVNVNVTIPTFDTTNVTLCGTNYTWAVNGQTYTNSGVYTVVSGCHTSYLFLTINPLPTVVVSHDTTVCANSTFALYANGADTYQWSISANGGSTWSPVAGATISVLSITPATTVSYMVLGTDVNGCQNTASVNITVRPLPSSNIDGTGAASCFAPNGNIFTLKGTSSNATPEWTVISNPNALNISWFSSQNIDSPVVKILGGTGGNVAFRYRVTSNQTPNCGMIDKILTVKVVPIPTVNTIPDVSVCPGTTVAAISFVSPQDTVSNPVSFTWSNINANVGLTGSNVSGNAPSFVAQNSSDIPIYDGIKVTPKIVLGGILTCTGNETLVRTLTVKPTPKIELNNPNDTVLCNGLPLKLKFTTHVTPHFKWASSGNTIGMQLANGNDSIPGFTATNNNGMLNAVRNFFVQIDTVNGCPGNALNFAVTVKQSPMLMDILTDSICSGSSFSFVPTPLNAATTITWKRVGPNGVNDTSIGSGSINQTISSHYNLAYTAAVYNFHLSVNGCAADTSLNVTVKPVPDAPTFTIANDFCHNTAFINLQANRAPYANEHFIWTALPDSALFQNQQYAMVKFAVGQNIIRLKSELLGTSCKTTEYVDSISNTPTPFADPYIIKKEYLVNGSLNHIVLVCLHNPVQNYHWGRTNATTFVEDNYVYAAERGQELYFKNPQDFDVNKYFYWVKIVTDTENNCFRQIYYNGPFASKTAETVIVNSNTPTGMKVYPNPAQTMVTIELTGNVDGNYQIKIQDIIGQEIQSVDMTDKKQQVDIQNLPNGYYLISCWHDGVQLTTTKLIKN
jgi:hypothetical protein